MYRGNHETRLGGTVYRTTVKSSLYRRGRNQRESRAIEKRAQYLQPMSGVDRRQREPR